MDAEYGQHYRDLYTRHWWWRAREAALVDLLNELRPAEGWGRILDVGCGDGLFFDRLLTMGEVEGIEPDVALVDAHGPHRARIEVRPFDEQFQPSEPYSLILMLDVLEHLDDPAAALRHAASLLTERGRLVVTVPAFRLLWTTHDILNHHRTRFTRSTFRRAAKETGLEISQARYWFQWTFGAKLATRIAERVQGATPAPPTVPAPWLNRLLYGLSRTEQRVLGPLHPPFGSSLVVVCGRRASRVPLRPPGPDSN